MIDLTELFQNPTFITILIVSILVITGIVLYIGISRTKESRLQKQNTKELDEFINNNNCSWNVEMNVVRT